MAGLRVWPLSIVHGLRALHAKLEIDDDGQMVATCQVKLMLIEQIKTVAQNMLVVCPIAYHLVYIMHMFY